MTVKDMIPDDAFNSAEQVTKELGLPAGFIINLPKEDDWSFIIKVSALLEGAVRHVLESSFGEYDITKFISTLSHRRRIDLAEQAKIITNQFTVGLKYISKLRNLVVHDISRVSFSFESHLSSSSNLNEFKNAILVGNVNGNVDLSGELASLRDILIENPKLAIIRFAVGFLSLVYVSAQLGRIQSMMDKILQVVIIKK